jgi:hypothetical protein
MYFLHSLRKSVLANQLTLAPRKPYHPSVVGLRLRCTVLLPVVWLPRAFDSLLGKAVDIKQVPELPVKLAAITTVVMVIWRG